MAVGPWQNRMWLATFWLMSVDNWHLKNMYKHEEHCKTEIKNFKFSRYSLRSSSLRKSNESQNILYSQVWIGNAQILLFFSPIRTILVQTHGYVSVCYWGWERSLPRWEKSIPTTIIRTLREKEQATFYRSSILPAHFKICFLSRSMGWQEMKDAIHRLNFLYFSVFLAILNIAKGTLKVQSQ